MAHWIGSLINCSTKIRIRLMSIVPHKKVDRTEYNRKYYQDNKEKYIKYRQDNREKRIEYRKKYRQDNKEKLIVRRAKTRANKNSVPFDIDEDYIKKIWPKHNICPIFKIKLEQGNLDKTPSLDRIIPKLGYVKGNVQIMSHKANRIKNNATFEELVIIGKYYERQLASRT